jgi:hypothetical protein
LFNTWGLSNLEDNRNASKFSSSPAKRKWKRNGVSKVRRFLPAHRPGNVREARIVEPTRDELIRVASILWGAPNQAASNGKEIRWGSKGSKSLDTVKRVWRDHETGEGGGWTDLYRLAGEPFPEEPRDTRSVPIATYEYRDADATMLFRVVRLSGHRFFQERANGTGGWIPGIAGVPRVLYRLPELLGAPDDDVVWVVEGEKDVDRLRAAGLMATTNPMGAGKWLPAYSEALRGRTVALLPDNDAVGRDHMAMVAGALRGVARSVRTVVLPGLGQGEDVSDWLGRGGSVEELERLYREAAPPAGAVAARLRRGSDFAGRYEMPNWLIEGVLQRGRLYACTSLTNHGKTAVWLYNSCMIQAGRPIAGLAVDQANVLYLAGENPTDLQGRMLGIMRDLGLRELPWVLPHAFPLVEEELERLKGECRAVEWGLIVGDTAASFFPGDDENDNVQAAAYGRALRSLCELPGNPAVMVLSHPTKNAARDNLLPRGGGALLNELDGNLVLWSESLGEMTTLHWQGKIRGPNFDPIAYKYRLVGTGFADRRGRDDMTVLAEPIDDFEAANHAKQAVANEDAVLAQLNRSPDFSLAQIASACGWIGEGGLPEKWRAQRSVERLRADKMIRRHRGRWVLTDAGKKELEKTEP